MTLITTAAELRYLGSTLYQIWPNEKDKVVLTGRNLYNLLSVKKKLEEQVATIEETVASLALQFGGEQQPDGSIKIGEESRKEASAALDAFSKEEITLEYTPIHFRSEDNMPIALMELLFNFIVFDDE